MTDKQKTEKLAKWLDSPKVTLQAGKWSHSTDIERHDGYWWLPLTNIADAWMLVEMAWEEAIRYRKRHISPILMKSEDLVFTDSIATYRPGKVPEFKVFEALNKRSKQEKLVYQLGCILACSISWKSNVTAYAISNAVLEVIA